jgi:hypothetical protein
MSNLEGNKDALKTAGSETASYLVPIMRHNSKMKVLIGLENENQQQFLTGLLANRNLDTSRVGYDLSAPKRLTAEQVPDLFRSHGVPAEHIWSSTGVTNWVPSDLTSSLEKCLDLRSKQKASRAYFWTADKVNTIVQYLRQGADALITNNIDNAMEALYRLSAHRRLARVDDSPFRFYSSTQEKRSRKVQDKWCALKPLSKYYCAYSTGMGGQEWKWTNIRCGSGAQSWTQMFNPNGKSIEHRTSAPICQSAARLDL